MNLAAIIIAYKAPNARDADLPALNVLGAVLSLGENSRLSKALTDESLTTFASADVQPSHDPGLFTVSAGLAPEAKHEQVEKIALAEVEKLKKEGVSAEEVSQVVNQYRAAQAYGRDGTAGTAAAINEWIAVGDWTQFVTLIDSVAKVTPADVSASRRTTSTKTRARRAGSCRRCPHEHDPQHDGRLDRRPRCSWLLSALGRHRRASDALKTPASTSSSIPWV